jgi:3-hydroxyisobutyrate dehydrogenase
MAIENPRLGFIGMGGMGSRMATRLLAAGYHVTVHNRNRERTGIVDQRGAKVAPEPGELSANTDIALSPLADDLAIGRVMRSPGGTLAGARPVRSS